ncbi:MAG: VWA domain-containing protein [Candidatus Cloacimonetes bacterium]|nr:VWA domain-containing protein [Candidatus Cloacimonadota bacterium]
MNIVYPHLLALLLICAFLFLLVFRRRKRVQKRFKRYAESHMMQHYFRSQSPFWLGFKLVILCLALASIVLALLRPQWDYAQKETESSGMDIVFAIDVSKSMDAQDMMPSRLMRAMMQISAFLDQVKTDRIGIITFAGVATLECPLTDDYGAVKIVLNSLSTDNIPKHGTNIGAALKLAADAFVPGQQQNTLILISDGEDLEGAAIKEAKLLKTKGVRIHTMGVGSPEGYLITNPQTGQEVMSKLDEAALTEIAHITGGEYYRVTPGGEEIQLILKRIYKNEEKRNNRKSVTVLKEQYHLFAGFALLLLILESLIDPRKRKGMFAAENSYET